MSYEQLSKDIIQSVGGEKNINNVIHCATRLRFTLNDEQKADKENLEKMKGIIGVVSKGGQFQVIVGTHVADVYKEIAKSISPNSDSGENKVKKPIGTLIFDVISRSFSPLIGALAGAGMLKALLTVLASLHVLSADSETYKVLAGASNAVFYFLPIFLGITLSIRLGVNAYVGGSIGAALLEPNITGLASVESPHFLGIPLVISDYSSSVFPIFIAICIYALLDKQLRKFIHKDLQMFLVPMICLIVIVPLTILAFGPFGVNVGNLIGDAILFLSTKSGIVTGAIVGIAWTYLTVLGLHWGLVPIILENIAKGGDPIYAMAGMAIFAQLGVALGIFLKTKDKQLKTLAGSTFIPGALSGVTEPIIYGLLTRYKRTFIYVTIAGGVGGALSGLFKVKMEVFAFVSVLSLPAFSPLAVQAIIAGVTIVLAMVITMVFGYEDKKKVNIVEEKTNTEKSEVILSHAVKSSTVVSPLAGNVIPLTSVDDAAFASEAMGKGIAIEPTEGKLYSPVSGVVSTIFRTGHCIAVVSDEGVEVLIHIGIETVKLKGKYFDVKVQEGATVTQGDLLIEFDFEQIKNEGYQCTTPIIITNTANYSDVIGTNKTAITPGEDLLTVVV
ncbi:MULTISPECIES: beta-glucoside-specific PTS transporter subunit IIABC [Paenibacillus]|uniref:beta-glucoside-specific PTS transporter subunit IIABC n=1 Tax=Paenibacillus TaxID=44249 RepID=UPI00096CE1AF|nr:beta-glucoside-specific PTS transporter subunit IIABC [Paenibacillus odorifer]MEC0131147.1 beta-glucoside-specific PTS transporter subunit IIABC [Paenibacillus odorifer]MEC0221372.1 beta-glucoside-specific PTS transporter subunit IIABC [Paenibacillus odorifer]OMC99477.1 PTS beta-glucoside transporter subunit EIIBCA [Paenibacillus odorifer]OMD04213.1 PTS beta-glucoside transporter subunit EIIBCA [Paenibacillus odorifer]OMD27345.1 PTS beta-glucoside transporter subunit EIIBCA [Paenibacillus o